MSLSEHDNQGLRRILRGCLIGMDDCMTDYGRLRAKAASVLDELAARDGQVFTGGGGWIERGAQT